MRVMTWNVWWRFGGNWRARAAGILTTLQTYQPDIVGLVETWSADGTTQPDVLAGQLGMHAAFAPTSLPPAPEPVEEPGQLGATVGLGLLSRWPVLRTEVRELPHPQRPGAPPTALSPPSTIRGATCTSSSPAGSGSRGSPGTGPRSRGRWPSWCPIRRSTARCRCC